MNFFKYHGNGNDFIFVEKGFFQKNNWTTELLREFAKKTCARAKGIGADGLVIYDLMQNSLLILNGDGSFAASCGNALRCYGLMRMQKGHWDGLCVQKVNRLCFSALEEQMVKSDEKFIFKNEFFATLYAGNLSTGSVSVGMAAQKRVEVFEVNSHPLSFELKFAVFVELTNPHLVFFHEAFAHLSTEEFKLFGQWVQTDLLKSLENRFPLSNVSMLYLKDKNWQLMVYERGAGLTLCCGTGAVASRVALEALQKIDKNCPRLSFHLPGGPVDISQANDHEYEKQWVLSGPSKLVFTGEWVLS